MNEAVLLAALGIVSAAMAALIWIIKFMFEKLVPVLEQTNTFIEHNTKVVKAADDYLKQRNGTDLEHHAAVLTAIQKIPTTMQSIADAQSKAILKAVGKDQHVTKQVVDTQVIKEKK